MKRISYILAFSINIIFLLSELNQCLAENKKYNRYLTFLFRKYGNGATITFEGLEHLMHNLGIGDLEFSPSHTIEEHFPTGYTPPDITSDEDLESYSKNILKNSTLIQTPTDSQKFIRNVIEYNDEFQILTNEVDFKEMHDPKHYHPKQIEKHNHDHGHGHSHGHAEPVKKSTKICLSPRGILNLISDENYKKGNKPMQDQTQYNSKRSDDEDEDNEMLTLVKITPSSFLKICPALLVQLDQQICSEYAPLTFVTSETSFGTSDFIYACIYASIAITILSACGLFGILIVPLMKSFIYNEILKFLVAVAVGTLGGDALMHLIPHALLVSSANSSSNRNSFDDHMDSILIFGCTFLTVIFMYCIESLLPLIRKSDSHGHGHGHSHGGHNHHRNHHEDLNNREIPSKNGINNHSEANNEHSNENNPESNITMLDDNKLDLKENIVNLPMTPVAFMVVIGDGLHNLTDGLAIGAAFAADPVTGMATAFAVLCHELPHELGDFALLIQTGLSIRRAVYLNIVSSILSFIGMALGLVIAGMHAGMVKWIYACTAGSFLYIALTDLIPELEKSEKSFTNSLIQILGILLGGLIMLLIALNETSLRTLFE